MIIRPVTNVYITKQTLNIKMFNARIKTSHAAE